MEKWHAGELDIRHDRAIGTAMVTFVKAQRARSIVITRGIIGCPHEEGIDYPLGAVCPRCPFWADRDRWKDA